MYDAAIGARKISSQKKNIKACSGLGQGRVGGGGGADTLSRNIDRKEISSKPKDYKIQGEEIMPVRIATARSDRKKYKEKGITKGNRQPWKTRKAERNKTRKSHQEREKKSAESRLRKQAAGENSNLSGEGRKKDPKEGEPGSCWTPEKKKVFVLAEQWAR